MYDLKTIKEKVNSFRVLIVDDEELIREGAIIFMKKFCTHVDGAKNGEEALKMFTENGPYAIVLTDICMPKMTGWELVKALKNIDTELFVAVMTGSPEEDGIFRNSCDMYMAKPINIDKMQTMLEMIISKRDQHGFGKIIDKG
ncbi:MAG: response regulator [Sulfuricurvum sp.]|jgi:two-component system response regulator YesN